PNSHLRQRPLLTVDEVVTPQVGNCTIFARYVEAGFATQIVLNARLTRLYEREDWKKRLASSNQNEPLLLERGLVMPPVLVPSPISQSPAAISTVERAARSLLTKIATEAEQKAGGNIKATPLDQMRARHQRAKQAAGA
ncbi:MAG: hypothetical protein SF029_18550, partial [bacterium]|nr:hypothetical protein [bacterium]